MTRITNSDQIMRLLRSQIDKIDRDKKKPAGVKGTQRSSPLELVKSLAQDENQSQSTVKNALIIAILAEQFGEDLVNDPNFRGMTNKLTKLLSEDRETDAILEASISDMRQAARS